MKLLEIKADGIGLIHINPDQVVAIRKNSSGKAEILLGSMVDFLTLNVSREKFLKELYPMGLLEVWDTRGDH
jgi:hypothetical protein